MFEKIIRSNNITICFAWSFQQIFRQTFFYNLLLIKDMFILTALQNTSMKETFKMHYDRLEILYNEVCRKV